MTSVAVILDTLLQLYYLVLNNARACRYARTVSGKINLLLLCPSSDVYET